MMDFRGRTGSLVLAAFTVLGGFAPARAQVVRAVTGVEADVFDHGPAALDDAGTVVYVISSADPVGTNPRHEHQVTRWALPGGSAQQVTQLADGTDRASVSVSDDGQWLVFRSSSDPLGQNHDESAELFVMRADGSNLTQLTNDPGPNAGDVFDATIAGSGNRAVFLANTNPLGTNPARHEQVFVIDRTGANLRQLTSASDGLFSTASISDDGAFVVFGHDADLDGRCNVFTVNADGTGLKNRHPGAGWWVMDGPVVSGNGSRIAFSTIDGGTQDDVTIVLDPLGTPVWSGEGTSPTLRDDGAVVCYAKLTSGRYEIFSRNLVTNTTTRLTFTTTALHNVDPVVSGNGGRIAYRAYGGPITAGHNPDAGAELMVMDATGANQRQLTDNALERGEFTDPQLSADGSEIVYLAFGPYAGTSLERITVEGQAEILPLDDLSGRWPSITADGGTIVFISQENLTGQNPSHQMTGFSVSPDGTDLVQLVPSGDPEVWSPMVSADGAVVVFETEGGRLFRVAPDGTGLALVVDDDDWAWKYPRVSADATWIVYGSRSNTDGANPDGSNELFRVRSDGSALLQLTTDPQYGSTTPDVSGSGDRIVYVSAADPLGTNSDHNQEIFGYDVSTATRRQLTVTPRGYSGAPRISRDGAYVYFMSTAPIFESGGEPSGPLDGWSLYRVHVDTGRIERADGIHDARASLPSGTPSYWNSYPSVSADGQRAVFVGAVDADAANHDLSFEIWLTDFTATARVHVGRPAPTLVTWDPDPRAVRYDVIRGDVASLGDGLGGTVDLGAVACLENDSPDPHTVGFEDSLQPAPGQAFFFLHRGSQGLGDGPGSWGQGSGGRERVVASGSCAD